VRNGEPQRRHLQCIRAAHVGRRLRPSRNAGIFTQTGRSWQLAGSGCPRLRAPGHYGVPAHLRRPRHHRAARRRSRDRERLLAAWSAGGGAHWKLSPPLPLNGATLALASSGPGSSLAILLNHPRAAVIISAAGLWRPLPLLPPGHRDPRAGPISRMERPGRPWHPAHHLAGRTHRPGLGQRPGRQSPRSVRLIRLTPLQMPPDTPGRFSWELSVFVSMCFVYRVLRLLRCRGGLRCLDGRSRQGAGRRSP
jgi:hypothetical protein